MVFDPSVAKERLDRFWQLNAEFGLEHHAVHVYLSEIVSDRYVLVNGLQLIHDELQLAGLNQSDEEGDDVVACGADLSLPSVMTTLAHTNCGDRIHQGEATITYEQIVAARFAFMSEIGESKLEAFSPTNGGTDDGVQVRLYNSRFPAGRTSDAWTFFESGGRAELAPFMAVGQNRIVLIHIDDNPTTRALRDVQVIVSGTRLRDCP